MKPQKPKICLLLAVTSRAAFLEIDAVPNIVRAFTTLAASFPSQSIIVATTASDGDEVMAALSKGADHLQLITCDPNSPQDLARTLRQSLSQADAILIHDAARPLVDGEQIEKTLRALDEGVDAVRPVMPFTETLKVMDADSVILRTVDRSKVFQISTPELIRTSCIDPDGEDVGWFLPLNRDAKLGQIQSNPLAVRISSQEHCNLVAAARS